MAHKCKLSCETFTGNDVFKFTVLRVVNSFHRKPQMEVFHDETLNTSHYYLHFTLFNYFFLSSHFFSFLFSFPFHFHLPFFHFTRRLYSSEATHINSSLKIVKEINPYHNKKKIRDVRDASQIKKILSHIQHKIKIK